MKTATIEPSLPQYEFLLSDEVITVFCGGLGSGKTFCLAAKLVEYVSIYPNATGCVAANTYKQLRDSTLAGIFKAFDEWGIDYLYKSSDSALYVGSTKIYCISLENYNAHRGKEIGWLLGDEAAYWDHDAWKVIIGRLRDKRGPLQARIATTPNGYNFLFELKEKGSNIEFVNSSTYQNKHLPEDYIRLLEEQYDPEMQKQELMGQFINLNAAAVYRAFDPDKNVREFEIEPTELIKIGTDFNVNPLTSVLGVVRGNALYIYDEVWLENANTFDLASELAKQAYGAELMPDASGNARKTSSTKSDHQILREEGFIIRTNKSNPAVRDRYNCVNGLLHHQRLIIHPRCKKLIRDFKLMTHNNKDASLSHISDALGYLCWYLWPLRRPTTPMKKLSGGL